MKRLIIVLLVLVCLSVAAIYIFIPNNLAISKVTVITCNPEAANRMIVQSNNWQKALLLNAATANQISDSANSFIYRTDTFKITRKLINALTIQISSKDGSLSSTLNIVPIGIDSTGLQWQSELESGSNPFTKIKRYWQALQIKQTMTDILNEVKRFLDKKENVYGMSIQKTSTKDTFLIATRAAFVHYPSTGELYSLVTRLQTYLSKKGAKQTNVPMVNVTKTESGSFNVMAAIPVNLQLPDVGDMFYRRMVPGNFLVAEVKGGPFAVDHAFDNMHLYITDYKKTSMAIPFQSLVTDRSKEPDSSKWVTRIYYPINY